MVDDSKITVHIELELEGQEIEKEEEEEVSEPVVEVDSEEILKMMEERHDDEDADTTQDIEEKEEEKSNDEKVDREEVLIEAKNEKSLQESEDVIMQNVDTDNEFTTYHIHMVKEGETVETICTMYNSNMNLLMDYNDLSNLTP